MQWALDWTIWSELKLIMLHFSNGPKLKFIQLNINLFKTEFVKILSDEVLNCIKFDEMVWE